MFDPTVLQRYYDAAVSLAAFVAAIGGIDFGKVRPEYYRMKGPPVALLALCALVLFVSDWDMNAAIAAFSRLLLAPAPTDLTLGNVIGLNPFHEYAAWRILPFCTSGCQKPRRTGLRSPACRNRGRAS